jgi:cytochrome c peroxidase
MARSSTLTFPTRGRGFLVVGTLSVVVAVSCVLLPNLFSFPNAMGTAATYDVHGPIDTSNPFFQKLGTNGRSCASCHLPSSAFGLGVRDVRARFLLTQGRDPLFAAVDGANCPGDAPGDPASHSLLLDNGLIRIAITLPSNAEFTLRSVHDPYGCGIVTDPDTGQQTVSVYRRPLPATNLRFLSAVMFDGRETIQPLNDPNTFAENLIVDLKHQALDATLGHAQAAVPPTDEQQAAIVEFELGLFSAQSIDNRAGLLSARGATGGPFHASQQDYYPGINDSLGGNPTGQPFDPNAFDLFAGWAAAPGTTPAAAARRQIAAGETIFDTHPLLITRVRGLNDNPALGSPAVIPGTCTTCHDAPNVGDHSLPVPLDIGTAHDPGGEADPETAAALAELSAPDVPVYEIDGCPDPFADAAHADDPQPIFTTDPGKALLSGRCADVNRIKGPILRGLAARAPYFHNGAGRTLDEVVDFYDQRFQMNLTDEEKAELVAFLNAL